VDWSRVSFYAGYIAAIETVQAAISRKGLHQAWLEELLEDLKQMAAEQLMLCCVDIGAIKAFQELALRSRAV